VAAWLTDVLGGGGGAGGGGLRVTVVARAVVRDDARAIHDAVAAWDARGDVALIVTSGGTGMGPRDVTPEALRPLIARPTPGLVHAMLAASLGHTHMAALSRYEAGVTPGGALLLQLPGSPKAVRECLAAVQRVLPHALALLRE
jgi:gephyrin